MPNAGLTAPLSQSTEDYRNFIFSTYLFEPIPVFMSLLLADNSWSFSKIRAGAFIISIKVTVCSKPATNILLSGFMLTVNSQLCSNELVLGHKNNVIRLKRALRLCEHCAADDHRLLFLCLS